MTFALRSPTRRGWLGTLGQPLWNSSLTFPIPATQRLARADNSHPELPQRNLKVPFFNLFEKSSAHHTRLNRCLLKGLIMDPRRAKPPLVHLGSRGYCWPLFHVLPSGACSKGSSQRCPRLWDSLETSPGPGAQWGWNLQSLQGGTWALDPSLLCGSTGRSFNNSIFMGKEGNRSNGIQNFQSHSFYTL